MPVNQITIYASAHSKQKLRPTRIREKSMNEKSYEQEQVERMIHILSQPQQGTTVHHWLSECWKMNGNVDYAIVVNPTNQTTVVYSTNKNAKIRYWRKNKVHN